MHQALGQTLRSLLITCHNSSLCPIVQPKKTASERGGDMLSVTSHPANSAAGIQTCRSDFGAGARCLCHAVSRHVPHFFPKTPFGNWREGSIHPVTIASWLGLNNHTDGPTLALVSLLPQGWRWGLARVPSFKGTPQCLPGRERTLWLAEPGYQC